MTAVLDETQVAALMQQLDVTNGDRAGPFERRRFDYHATPGAELRQLEAIADLCSGKFLAHHLAEFMAERKAMLAQYPTVEELGRRHLGAPKNFQRMDAAVAQVLSDMQQGRRVMSVAVTHGSPHELASNGKICDRRDYR